MSKADQTLREKAPLFMKLIDELEKAQRSGSAADQAIATRYLEERRRRAVRQAAQFEIPLEPSTTPINSVLDPALYDAEGDLVDLSGARERPRQINDVLNEDLYDDRGFRITDDEPRERPRSLGQQAEQAAARIAEAKRRAQGQGSDWRRILNENQYSEQGYEIDSAQAIIDRSKLDAEDGRGLMNNIKTFVGALTGMIGVFGFPRPVVDAIIAGTAEILLNHYRSRTGRGWDAEAPAKITRPIEFEDI